jgi:hypothetical protein
MPALTTTTQRSIVRNIVLSPHSQDTIGEALADAALTYRARPETSGFAQWTGEYETDYQYAGKTTSMATESRLITQQSAFDLSTRLDDFLAGQLFAFVMGQENFVDGVAPAPNTHTFTWKDTSDPAPLTTLYIEDAAALKQKWADMAYSQLVLSGANKGSVGVKLSGIGLGTRVKAPMAQLPAVPVAKYLSGSDSIISIGPVGAPVSLLPRVLSWEATFDHQMEIFRACGCGTTGFFIRMGTPLNKLKLVIAVDATSDVYDWVANQTALEVKIAVATGTTSLVIDYPNINLPQTTIGEQDKYVAYTVDLDQNSIKQPLGGGESVTVTVMNSAEAYLVAA